MLASRFLIDMVTGEISSVATRSAGRSVGKIVNSPKDSVDANGMGIVGGGRSPDGVGSGYVPNAGAVGNMREFLRQPGLGTQVGSSSRKTSQIYQGQSVYKADKPIGDYIAKGDQFYLDGMHKNHLEVFDGNGKFKVVLNLDGTYNADKTYKAISEGRRLRK